MALIECSECKKQISSKADQCPGCGNPIKKKKSYLGPLVFFFLGILIVAIYMPREKTSKAELQNTVCKSPVMAYRFTKNFVRAALKSPSTAKFPDYSSYFVKPTTMDCTYWISTHVDSQNGFGAMLRTEFSITVQYDKIMDSWTIVEASID